MIKFKQFESIMKSIDEGVAPMECGPIMESEKIDEGIFSDIMNYFSKLLGGKVSKLDKLVEKYKSNEHDYWAKWADANFKYNNADALQKQTTDPTEKTKYMEMKERADKLLSVVDSSRDEINDALQRQAKHVIKSNVRLGDYYVMIKAKADEEVANDSYKKLKKLSDKDTVDTLYKKVEVDSVHAREKEEAFKKKYGGQVSGDYTGTAKRDDKKEVPFKEFGITDLDDFVMSDDKHFYAKLEDMPKANMKMVVDFMKKLMTSIDSVVDKEIKKYNDQLKNINPADTEVSTKRKTLENDIESAREAADDDLEMLKDRINKIENKMLVG